MTRASFFRKAGAELMVGTPVSGAELFDLGRFRGPLPCNVPDFQARAWG